MATPFSYTIVVLMVAAAAMPLELSQGAECPTEGLVYSSSPAVYWQEVYEVEDATTSGQGQRAAPQYDESTGIYYMRLADAGAKYQLIPYNQLISYNAEASCVSQSQNLAFINPETGRYLAWSYKRSSSDPFLAESFEDPAQLKLVKASNSSYPELAYCEAYYIAGFLTSRNVVSYGENGTTYLRRASASSTNAGLPFLLRRSTYPVQATGSSVQLATLRSFLPI